MIAATIFALSNALCCGVQVRYREWLPAGVASAATLLGLTIVGGY